MNKRLKLLFLIISFGLNCQLGFCQEIKTNKSRVVDKAKQGIPYVNIYFQDRQIGTITDSLGYFSIDEETIIKNINDSIVFSCLGYNNTSVNIQLIN